MRLKQGFSFLKSNLRMNNFVLDIALARHTLVAVVYF
jgi:hypothetical protein